LKPISKKEDITQYGEKHISETRIPTQNEFEDALIISRLACVVAKEEPMQRMLRLIQKHRHGIPTKELVRIISRWRYRQTLINQAIYFGLILEINVAESNDGLFCYLTKKGFKVLETCKNVRNSNLC
jgi:hypothetical protein